MAVCQSSITEAPGQCRGVQFISEEGRVTHSVGRWNTENGGYSLHVTNYASGFWLQNGKDFAVSVRREFRVQNLMAAT
ncbi:hypothetical protein M8818_005129 [Zalaria obscura]|uniref:Uncharacterized protein n=1 Tax=Zalaria obscura TaxID=2024903 RepID=A0ACC3SA92_9PEZI